MALEVVWTDEAKVQLDEIITYLENNWTNKEIISFFRRLEEGLIQISENPHRFKQSDRMKGAREFQLFPHTTLFYSYNDRQVAVMVLWANRKNPGKLK